MIESSSIKNSEIDLHLDYGLNNSKEKSISEAINKKIELIEISVKDKNTAINSISTLAPIDNPTINTSGQAQKKSFKTQKKYRAIMLISQCLIGVGIFYAFDNPQALQIPLNNTLGIDNVSYNLFYSVYSIPNTILPFIGGFIVDYYGVRVGIFLFTLGVTIGQGIVWLGGYVTVYWVILLGRIFLGLTGECIQVAQQDIAIKWFKNSLGKSIALSISFARIGSAGNSFLTPKLYEHSGNLSLPLMVSFLICLFSFLVGLFAICMDRKADQQEGILNQRDHHGSIKTLFQVNRIRSFNKLYWILVLYCGLTYSTFIGFLNISNAYISNRFNYTQSNAGNIIAIYYLTSLIITPLAGKFGDKFGKRIYLIFTSNIILLATMLAWFLVPNCNECPAPAIIFVFMGLAVSTFAGGFWPSIALIVDSKLIGIGTGFVFSGLHTCLIVIPIIIGKIQDKWSFHVVNAYLVIQAGIPLLLVFIIKYLDMHTGNRLDQKPNSNCNACEQSKKNQKEKKQLEEE